MQMASWGSTLEQWKRFECDGSCNGDSDVCTHLWVWNCPDCGDIVGAQSEEMGVFEDYNGKCHHCAENCCGYV